MPRKPKQAADDGLTLHTTFRLPRELHELLTKAAAEHGYGIGEEIRRRLEASFAPDAMDGDAKTHELVATIATAARLIGAFYAPWHKNPYSLAVVRSAVATLLTALGPKGDPVFQPIPDTASDVWFDPADPPETVGRMLAMTALTAYAESIP